MMDALQGASPFTDNKKKEVKAPPPQVDLLAIASLQCFCIFFQGGFSGKENLFFMIC
jgi:hypothetical protein